MIWIQFVFFEHIFYICYRRTIQHSNRSLVQCLYTSFNYIQRKHRRSLCDVFVLETMYVRFGHSKKPWTSLTETVKRVLRFRTQKPHMPPLAAFVRHSRIPRIYWGLVAVFGPSNRSLFAHRACFPTVYIAHTMSEKLRNTHGSFMYYINIHAIVCSGI